MHDTMHKCFTSPLDVCASRWKADVSRFSFFFWLGGGGRGHSYSVLCYFRGDVRATTRHPVGSGSSPNSSAHPGVNGDCRIFITEGELGGGGGALALI